MAGRKKNPEQTSATRMTLLEKSFELFSERTIEKVTMVDIARESGYGEVTVYRYFRSKPQLVVETAIWRWQSFFEEINERRPGRDSKPVSAAELFEFFLDSLLVLYEKHRDLLRFNQFFNVYVQSEKVDRETLKPYQGLIQRFRDRFHEMYEKAKDDKTVRTDLPEGEMFSVILHLMLAALTRYAVGLVYIPEGGFDEKKELSMLKDMLMDRYVRGEGE